MHSSVGMPGNRAKPLGRWVGPYQIISTVNEYVYRIKHIITNKILEAHAVRMRFYSDASLDITEELKKHVAQQGILLDVKTFLGHKKNESGEWALRVQWAGFEQSEATWEPLSTLAEDVPVLIAQYAATLPNESELFVTAAREQVGKKSSGRARKQALDLFE